MTGNVSGIHNKRGLKCDKIAATIGPTKLNTKGVTFDFTTQCYRSLFSPLKNKVSVKE